MPRPCVFQRVTELEGSPEKAFAFHGDPHNILAITPRWQRVEIIHADATPRAGAEFELVIRFFGFLPLRWRGVWREVEGPALLVDGALRGPFAFWRHRHEFRAHGPGRTLMTDHVEYLFPGGWLGKWFGDTLGRLQFHLMFADRHARTRRWMHDHA